MPPHSTARKDHNDPGKITSTDMKGMKARWGRADERIEEAMRKVECSNTQQHRRITQGACQKRNQISEPYFGSSELKPRIHILSGLPVILMKRLVGKTYGTTG